MLLGTSKQDITPLEPIKLAGFAHRKDEASETFDKLYLKSFLLKHDGTFFLLLIADLIWWDTEYVKKMKVEIEEQFHIPRDQIVFHATHNHSGPQTSSRFSKQLGEISLDYLDYLRQQTMQSIENTFLNMEEVNMFVNEGASHIGINRRKKMDGNVIMAPNLEGEVDNGLKVFSFIKGSDEVKAVWIHYSCHPNSTDENVISSEFPGICCRKIEEVLPGCLAGFLQGFCGDIRPSLIKNGDFYRGTIGDMVHVGEELFYEVNKLIATDGKICSPTSFTFLEKEISLSFMDENVESRVPDQLRGEWTHLVQKIAGDYKLIFQYIKLCDHLEFIACNAELVHAYGKYMKKQSENIIPLGYSNGMIGYIPTAEQVCEGGYEAEESIFYFGYPNKIDSKMEKIIKQLIDEIIRKDFYDDGNCI